MTEVSNVFGIVANVESDRILRTGAKVWVCYCNGDAEKPRVVGLNKGGRVTEKYIPYKRLTNFRAAWIPEHLRSLVHWQFASKDEAAGHAAALSKMWEGVRAFHRDGTLLKDGISAGEAFRQQLGAAGMKTSVTDLPRRGFSRLVSRLREAYNRCERREE